MARIQYALVSVRMSRCAIILAVAAIAAAQDLPDSYIVGGIATSIGNYPYQVSLEHNETNSHFCGGAIFSEKYIVTAAHCVVSKTAERYKVRVGTSHHGAAGKIYAVEWQKLHPLYRSQFLGNDVAVLKLNEAIIFGPTAQPVKLTSLEPRQGDILTVTGWGVLRYDDSILPSVLQAVRVPLIDRALCAFVYKSITATEICAGVGGKDSCQGDSGGPLINGKRELVGIVSTGFECGTPGYPGIYTNIASESIRGFILENTQE